MRTALIAVAVGLLALPGAAQAADHFVSMPGKVFSPAQLTVVGGDEVVFRNSDFTGDDHDVRAVDGSFQTGRLARFGSFRARFDAVARHDYVCSIHPGMAGSITVAPALLDAPAQPGLAGDRLTLSGRAVPGSGHVTIERAAAGGQWSAEAHAVPAPDGTFTAEIRPQEPGSYRAVAEAGAGPAIEVPVLSGLEVATSLHRTRRARVVHAHVTPAATGVFAVLERYSRERFSWRRTMRVRLDAEGMVMFRLKRRARGLVRVVLERERRGVPLAVGTPLVLRSGRPGSDPTAGDVPAGEAHDGEGSGDGGEPEPAHPGGH